SLLSDADSAGEISLWLGQNRGVRRATAASHGAAAAVKEPEFHVTFLCNLMQFAMGFVQLPSAGEHTAVFVGVGVAEHDFLPAPPGIEQWLIVGTSPQAAHDAAGGAQGIDRLK